MTSNVVLPFIPASLRCDRRGSCVPVALYCLPKLVEGRDFIVEGWVSFGGRKQDHTWMTVAGELYDPTLIQFRRFKMFHRGPAYTIGATYSPAEYRGFWYCTKSSWWRERLQDFGVPRASWAFE